MNSRPFLAIGFAVAMAPLVPACSAGSPGISNPGGPNDGAAPPSSSGGGSSSSSSSGGGSSSGGSSSGGSSSGGGSSSSGSSSGSGYDAGLTNDSGSGPKDSGGPDTSFVWDGGCIRPPYSTMNECTGIGMPGGPKIPSCSIFNASGQLVCPTIPGCTVVPDPSGTYCQGDNKTCGLSECGHICILPNWDPCYDVATGMCLEGAC
jgi:hypothetical protein